MIWATMHAYTAQDLQQGVYVLRIGGLIERDRQRLRIQHAETSSEEAGGGEEDFIA